MRTDWQLNEEETEIFLAMVAKTDARNAAMGVSGPEVAQYNLRVLRLQSLKRHLDSLGSEPEKFLAAQRLDVLVSEQAQHAVTQKIAAYQAKQT